MNLDWVEKWAQWEVIKNWIGLGIFGVIVVGLITYLVVKSIRRKIKKNKEKRKYEKEV